MKIRELLLTIVIFFFVFVLLTLLLIGLYAEIDPHVGCKGLTLKECYDYCEDQWYLVGQDCSKIIRELKETREILGEIV